MEKKFNLVKILENCPTGMELDSPIWDGVVFDHIDIMKDTYPIYIKKMGGIKECLTENGYFDSDPGAKCVIFPKGKDTWEGFQRPFKDGDIVCNMSNEIIIYKKIDVKGYCGSFASLDYHNTFIPHYLAYLEDTCRFATEVEKEKLFDAIRANGYKWNFEKKTLEKFIVPKFKAGDKVRHEDDKTVITIITLKDDYYIMQFYNPRRRRYQYNKTPIKNQDQYELVPENFESKSNSPKFKVGDILQNEDAGKVKITEVNIDDEVYGYEHVISKGLGGILFSEEDNWKLVPNKFNITSLKPFDKVLVRTNGFTPTWTIDFYAGYEKGGSFTPFAVSGGKYFQQCIPYEGNEHLLGTKDDCDEFYKNWKD